MVLLNKQNKTVNPSLHQLSLVPRGREGCKPKNGVDKLLPGRKNVSMRADTEGPPK